MKEEDDEIIRVGILLFEGVDLLGVAGSAEVFAATDNFEVFTVGLNKEPVVCQNLISILPAFSLEDCPAMDILVVPGGEIEPLLENHQLICWIRSCSIKVKYVLSVCKGATLLAKAGLLNKREVASFPTLIISSSSSFIVHDLLLYKKLLMTAPNKEYTPNLIYLLQ